MRKMKYIVMDNGQWDAPVIFDEAVQHFEMVGYLSGTLLSAGFVVFTPTGLECYGESISLGVKARPEDTELINRMIGAPQ